MDSELFDDDVSFWRIGLLERRRRLQGLAEALGNEGQLSTAIQGLIKESWALSYRLTVLSIGLSLTAVYERGTPPHLEKVVEVAKGRSCASREDKEEFRPFVVEFFDRVDRLTA